MVSSLYLMIGKAKKYDLQKMLSAEENSSRIHLGWNFEKTKLFYKSNKPKIGDTAIIVSTQASCVRYEKAEINRVTATRIYFEKSFGWGGSSFYYSGKNCWAPKGQTRLIPPVPKFMEYMNSANKYELTFSPFLNDELLKFHDEIDARVSG